MTRLVLVGVVTLLAFSAQAAPIALGGASGNEGSSPAALDAVEDDSGGAFTLDALSRSFASNVPAPKAYLANSEPTTGGSSFDDGIALAGSGSAGPAAPLFPLDAALFVTLDPFSEVDFGAATRTAATDDAIYLAKIRPPTKVVPEPASLMLFGLGVAAMSAYKVRKRAS
jgi:hypothetical protein